MKRFLRLLLMCSFMITGCSDMKGNADYLSVLDVDNCPYEEFIVVDVFDFSANYQGIQSGMVWGSCQEEIQYGAEYYFPQYHTRWRDTF